MTEKPPSPEDYVSVKPDGRVVAQKATVGNSRPREIQRLLPRHYQIMDLLVEGLTQQQIADYLNVTRQAINLVCNSPVFKHELARRRAERIKRQDIQAGIETANAIDRAKLILEEALPKAAEKHVELLNHSDAAIAQRSANSILDRALGLAGKSSGSAGPAQIVIQADQVQLLQLALQEDRRDE